MEATEGPLLYIVLPAYNEEGSLGSLLGRIRMAMGRARYRVIVVNDGSTDGTAGVIRAHSALMPVESVDHEGNRGFGVALRSGLARAGRLARDEDTIVTMDADDTHPPDLIHTMVERLGNGYDVVVASRFVTGAAEVGLSAYRRFLSHASSRILRVLFPMRGVRDYTCGFRAYRGAAIRKALAVYGPRLVEERGFACLVDVLLKLRRLGVRATEVPLVLRYDYKKGASKMRVGRTMARYGALIVRNLVASGSRPFRVMVQGPPAIGDGLGGRVG